MLDRSWAKGLNQGEFTTQYLRRFPFADVIPEVGEWVEGSEPVYHGITPPLPDDYEVDYNPDLAEKKEKPQNLKRKDGYACRGCGKKFNYPIARAGHERGCKTKLHKEA